MVMLLVAPAWPPAVFASEGGAREAASDVGVPTYGFEIVNAYPHDPGAFTQGLVICGGVLYESTGLYGRSTLRRVDLETGRVLKVRALNPANFGEGLACVGNRLYQLTWQSGLILVYDKETFSEVGRFRYGHEGWGITSDGSSLIASDGSSELRFLDPETLEETRSVTVTDRGHPVARLNELEYIKGEIFANIWQEERIVRISPKTGRVESWVDLSGLRLAVAPEKPGEVLNGIAYDAAGDRLFVTGKLWPRLFEIRLVRR